MIEFKLQVENASAVRFAFGGMAAAVRDWRKYIWPGVTKDAIRPWLKRQFAMEGHGAHGRWKELSQPYAARKAKRWPGEKILSASGKMKRSLLAETNMGTATPRTLLYGTDIKYARYHQTGTRKMPARRIFDPEEGHEKETLPGMIRVSVARSVTNYARRRGFAIEGSGADAATAVRSGRSSMSSVSGGM